MGRQGHTEPEQMLRHLTSMDTQSLVCLCLNSNILVRWRRRRDREREGGREGDTAREKGIVNQLLFAYGRVSAAIG